MTSPPSLLPLVLLQGRARHSMRRRPPSHHHRKSSAEEGGGANEVEDTPTNASDVFRDVDQPQDEAEHPQRDEPQRDERSTLPGDNEGEEEEKEDRENAEGGETPQEHMNGGGESEVSLWRRPLTSSSALLPTPDASFSITARSLLPVTGVVMATATRWTPNKRWRTHDGDNGDRKDESSQTDHV